MEEEKIKAFKEACQASREAGEELPDLKYMGKDFLDLMDLFDGLCEWEDPEARRVAIHMNAESAWSRFWRTLEPKPTWRSPWPGEED